MIFLSVNELIDANLAFSLETFNAMLSGVKTVTFILYLEDFGLGFRSIKTMLIIDFPKSEICGVNVIIVFVMSSLVNGIACPSAIDDVYIS